jgi:hypothetical protein
LDILLEELAELVLLQQPLVLEELVQMVPLVVVEEAVL